MRRLFRLPWRSARALQHDVDEELRFHLDMRADELAARRGLDPASARAEALRQFGDVDDARRYMRAMDHRTETATRRQDFMESIRQDLAQAMRSLRRSPGFAAVVVLALAFGIGANTAIFTAVNAVLLRPLPVPEPGQLVGFGDRTLVGVTNGGAPTTDIFSYPLYLDLRDRAKAVPALFASGFSSRLDVVLSDSAAGGGAGAGAGAEPEHPSGRLVSGNFFSVLRVPAALGRTLAPSDDVAPGAGPVAVISHSYWRRRFALDPSVVGRTILVNRTPITIVGVAPPGFAGEIVGRSTDIWMPLTMQPVIMANQDWLRDRNTNWLLMMGRLGPGATVAQAQAEVTMLTRQALAASGAADSAATVRAYGAARGFVGMPGAASTVLVMLLGLTALVLLIVSANVANLLLARAASRRTEIGVRLALGAGRLRVMRHLLAESVILGLAAGALAIVVVRAGGALLVRQAEASGGSLPVDVAPDAHVLGYALALSLVIALVLGLVPAAHATRVDLATALRSHARGLTGDPFGGGGRFALGKLLVMGQVALSLVLLAGAGLLVRSARNLERTEVGAAQHELLMVIAHLQTGGYAGDRVVALSAQIADRLGQLPGVRAVTYSQSGIFSGIEASTTLQVDGFTARATDDSSALTDQVGPGFFRTVGARLVRGRDIEPRDRAGAPRVAVINESMARFYFAGRDPIGRRFRVDTTQFEIVGVVGDIADGSLRARTSRRYYSALAQGGGPGTVVFELRTAGDPARLAAAARREILAVAPAVRVRPARSLAALVEESMTAERLMARLAGVAGFVALALTALGLYGVMSYTIVRRTGEFGLRMALGAQPADLTRMVLRETMTLVALGAVVGVPAAVGAALLMRSQLVGVGVVDPLTLAAALLVLAGIAALAGYRPARRASRVAPQVALAHE